MGRGSKVEERYFAAAGGLVAGPRSEVRDLMHTYDRPVVVLCLFVSGSEHRAVPKKEVAEVPGLVAN